MKKGQLFIITVVMIGFALSGILSFVPHLELERKSDYIETNPTTTVRKNVEKEMISLVKTDPYNTTRFEKSFERMEKSSRTRGIELDVDWDEAEPEDCDVDLDKAMTPLNSSGEAWEFNIEVRDPGEIETSSKLIVCWE